MNELPTYVGIRVSPEELPEAYAIALGVPGVTLRPLRDEENSHSLSFAPVEGGVITPDRAIDVGSLAFAATQEYLKFGGKLSGPRGHVPVLVRFQGALMEETDT